MKTWSKHFKKIGEERIQKQNQKSRWNDYAYCCSRPNYSSISWEIFNFIASVSRSQSVFHGINQSRGLNKIKLKCDRNSSVQWTIEAMFFNKILKNVSQSFESSTNLKWKTICRLTPAPNDVTSMLRIDGYQLMKLARWLLCDWIFMSDETSTSISIRCWCNKK